MKCALMFLAMNVFLLWATQAQAYDPNAPVVGIYTKGHCFSASSIHLEMEEKIDATHYVLSQYMGAGSAEIGSLETFKGTQFSSSGRITNVNISYVTSKMIDGGDGFKHKVDFWKQCDFSKAAK